MGKSKEERLAESRERTLWLEIDCAIDALRNAWKLRDKNLVSASFEALEEPIAQLRGEEVQATDGE